MCTQDKTVRPFSRSQIYRLIMLPMNGLMIKFLDSPFFGHCGIASRYLGYNITEFDLR